MGYRLLSEKKPASFYLGVNHTGEWILIGTSPVSEEHRYSGTIWPDDGGMKEINSSRLADQPVVKTANGLTFDFSAAGMMSSSAARFSWLSKGSNPSISIFELMVCPSTVKA